MNIPALACALLCLFAAPELTKAQSTFGLIGLRRVWIVIQPLNKAEEGIGLDRESLKDQILVALKRDIPKLEIESSIQGSYIYLQITSAQTEPNRVATHVAVTLTRPVKIIGDDGSKTEKFATVWEKGTLLYDTVQHMASRIRGEISQAMTAFAAQYYNDNPEVTSALGPPLSGACGATLPAFPAGNMVWRNMGIALGQRC